MRNLSRALSITCLLAAMLTGSAGAGPRQGQSLLTVGGGGVFAWSDQTQDFVGGWSVIGSYERVISSNYTGGIAVSYFQIQEGGGGANNPFEAEFRSFPVMAYLKYVLGSPDGSVIPYVGGGAGLHYSRFSGLSNTLEGDESRVGIVFGVPLGVNFGLSDSIYLNLQYTLIWLTNTFYRNSLANLLTAGIGFEFGK